jgi:CMP-N-acetylneuraminic acid synthetase
LKETFVSNDLLILIPARAGSKGILRKNTVLLSGKPLLSWTAEAAIESQLSKYIVLSTDSIEIAKLGEDLGLKVPFIRPKDLAQDRTLQIEVIKHAIKELNDLLKIKFSSVMLLQPTSPFRSSNLIIESYNYFVNHKADTLITISDISKYAPSTQYVAEKSFSSNLFQLELLVNSETKYTKGTLRQDFKEIWWRNGSVYIFSTDTLLSTNSLYGGKTIGMVSNYIESINLDTEEDLEIAKIIAQGLGYQESLHD